jgi:hypothetical protein
MTPLYVVELDCGDGLPVTWEFYDSGVVRFSDGSIEEWAPLWEYGAE